MLLAADVKPGDEVITQANTFIATVLPMMELGAKPVLVDVDEMTGAIDIDKVRKAITKKTRAILPVHLFGRPAPMNELFRITNHESRITVLEDAAQAHGSTINGKRAGSFGSMAAFSFYPGKNLGAYGDAGAITTNNKKLADMIRIVRNIGMREKYNHVVPGFNSRLDTIQAAILSVKLKHLNDWNAKRDNIAKTFVRELSGVGDLVTPPLSTSDAKTNWHIFPIRTKKRDQLIKYLAEKGIHCGIHYPVPLHMTPALKSLGYKKGDFPISELRAETMLSLPMYAELTERQQAYIVATIKRFFR
jgi:dTDP-4-amino-4,6-dideoxygalactose transaminase